jgi:hypothetical protein
MRRISYFEYLCISLFELSLWLVCGSAALAELLGPPRAVFAYCIVAALMWRSVMQAAYLHGVHSFRVVASGVTQLLVALTSPRKKRRIWACLVLSAIAGDRFGSPFGAQCPERWHTWLSENSAALIWDAQTERLTEVIPVNKEN